MEILEVRAAGPAPQAGTVLRAYFDARRARASRRFLCCAAPTMMVLLVAVQAADGLLVRGALIAQTALSVSVPAAAAVAEWRAARKLRALLRASHPSQP